jgi:hypothetical protein
MEIQQPSSVGQATAPYTGLTQRQVQDTIKRIYPYRALNTLLHSKNAQEAISSTGSYTDFKERDYIEAHRLLQGVITNPWQSIHDIEAGKADPFYYDSGVSDIQDIQQKTMGTVTGASDARDPRAGFVDNLMKMKMFQKKVDNDHSYNYLTNLFLTQVENGSTYYQTQALRQNAELGQRTSRQLTSRPAIDHHIIIKNTNMGSMSAPHSQRKRNVVYNPTPHFTHNVKRAKLDDLHHRFTKHIDEGGHKHPHTTTSTPIEPPLGIHPSDIMGSPVLSPMTDPTPIRDPRTPTSKKSRRPSSMDMETSPITKMTPFGRFDPTEIPTTKKEESPNRTANSAEIDELNRLLNSPEVMERDKRWIRQRLTELSPAQNSIVTLTPAGETIHSVVDEENQPTTIPNINEAVVNSAIEEFQFPVQEHIEFPDEKDSTQFQTPAPSPFLFSPLSLRDQRRQRLVDIRKRNKEQQIKYIKDPRVVRKIYNESVEKYVTSDPDFEDFADLIDPTTIRASWDINIFSLFSVYDQKAKSGQLSPAEEKKYHHIFKQQEEKKDLITQDMLQKGIDPIDISSYVTHDLRPRMLSMR